MSETRTRERFPSLSKHANPVELEKSVLEYWESAKIFERTQTAEEEASKPHYIFYEGPPTANGMPGVHHIITRLAKDAVCRYKSMNGHFVLRKAGWDTHGLPVELEVQKTLGLSTKQDIEDYGVAEFNAKCKESVFKYESKWRELTRRIGYWLDMESPYITCTADYVESVWWLLKQMWDAGLIYEGHKVMPYNPRLGTVYSSHEVAQGYKEVDDPSVTVRFPCKFEHKDASFLVWTTTPWTLLSNVALAVNPDLNYVKVRVEETDGADPETLILAEARMDAVLGDRKHYVLYEMKGSELVDLPYERLYEFADIPADKRGAVVVAADFVSAEDGTGIVHMAPAYGADDYEVGKKHDLGFIDLVGPDGKVRPEATPFAGLDFKAADPEVIKDLERRGLMFAVHTFTHNYPHCWRDHGPLIYYAQPAWFIRTTELRDRFLAANDKVRWVPAEYGVKRFGDWLEGNIDWALSRDRYWGTPLPIWRTESGETVCIGSFEELRALAVDAPEEIDPHKPFVDEIELTHPETGETMRRVPDVIDAWFDSGSMPFAQWHYPFENEARFESQFPADFISEAVDQSRGWFYTLLAISVFARDCSPYKNVLVCGHVMDVEGKKMSKSLGNSIDAFDLLDREGADAVRLYMTVATPISQALKFEPEGPREMNSKMLGTLRNTYAFFSLYANLDGWTPEDETEPVFSLLDRWIRSRYETLVASTRRDIEAFDLTRAAKGIGNFIMEELSNWYVRRSRRRFWKGEMTGDKAAAYRTLYEILEGLCRLCAPFVPFLSEALFRNLRGEAELSVHLADYPQVKAERRDEDLEASMETLLQVVGLGRTLRNQSAIKIRQPLRSLDLAGGGPRMEKVLGDEELCDLVIDELNVKRLSALDDPTERMRFVVKPRFKILGPRLGGAMKEVARAMAALDPEQVRQGHLSGTLQIEAADRRFKLEREEMDFSVEALGEYAVGLEGSLAGALHLDIDEELAREGHLRELINRVQNLRKKVGLEVSDRIRLRWSGGELTRATMSEHGEFLAAETLALSVEEGPSESGDRDRYELAGEEVVLEIEKA